MRAGKVLDRLASAHAPFVILFLTIAFSPLGSKTCAMPADETLQLPQSIAPADPYWDYYGACDRWGIQFSYCQLSEELSSSIDKRAPSVPQQLDDQRAKPRFQQIKFVRPKFARRNVVLEVFVASKKQVRGVLAGTQSLAYQQFQRYLKPALAWMEFSSVESATYDGFFLANQLRESQHRVNRLLKQIGTRWGSIVRETAVSQPVSSAIGLFYQLRSQISGFLIPVLQKYTTWDLLNFETSDF